MSPQNLDLDVVATVIGYSASRVLAAWFPGARVHIPTRFDIDHPLVTLLGSTPVQKLVDAFGGERLAVPSAEDDARYRRLRLIAELLAAGASAEAVAGHLDMTGRRIEQIRSQLEDRGWLVFAKARGVRYRGRPACGPLSQGSLILGTREGCQTTPHPSPAG